MASLAADVPSTETPLRGPAFQAFSILRVGFTVAPILFGLDRFTEWMVDWSTGGGR